ncbi:MAG: hypothetical protein JF587_08445 [Catenulisporales bacterium]|nr:hypothetical protein [Catenulisporales bacterium]
MVETGNWVEPEVTTTGCCELSRWQLRLAGAEDDCFQSRLAGLAVNSAAPADVLLAVARGGGRLPRLVLAERLCVDFTFCEEYPDVAAA